MNVAQLKSLIANLPDDMEVVIQTQPGRGTPLADIDSYNVYTPNNAWSGELHYTEFPADDVGMDEEEWAEFCRKPRCLLLHPTG